MTEYCAVRSTVRPDAISVDETSVCLHTGITAIHEATGDGVFDGYEYDMLRYDKDEYIALLIQQKDALDEQVTDLQLALCELYEGMV